MTHPLLLLAAAILFISQAGLSRAAAQSPPAPASGVLDPAGFFARDPAALARIAARLEKLDRERDFRIFLAVEPAVISTTVPALANQLRQDWLPRGEGLAIVFESDSRRLSAGGNPTETPPAGGAAARVPFPESMEIFSRALADGARPPATAADLADFADALASGYESYFARRSQPPPPERSLRLILLAVGAMAVVGLVAIAAGGWMKHHAATVGARFRFPPSDLPERLGAPAGAAVTSRRFSRNPRG